MVTVSPEPTMVDGKMMYESGTTVTLTANQYTGLVTFTNWSDGTTGVDKAITMSEDITLTANYAETDIIAGWDFYVAGNNGRPADFASADNQSAALSLVNTSDGTTSGWLDKSTAKGGYESFKGAAVNWTIGASNGDVGYYHWQTKVNAEAFQNINVQFQMLYNYNAYQTYDVEYSLDGTNWTNFGSINMTGAKAVASFSQTLPAECNNQANLYIRMIADKNSTVAGAESKNDGNTLAMFFITGTEQLENDGVAPVLVSTVPANNATGASVSGKVVLTFDEKVKADNAVATLNGENLTATVSGKTVTFAYKDLEYNTQYTFSLPANSIGDLTDNMYAEAITIAFTTKTKDPVTKGLYDAVVSNVDELLTAINNANSRSDKNTRYRIFIKKGTYTIPLYSTTKKCNGYEVQECITFLTGSNVSFIGEDRDEVVITNAIPADATFAGTYGTTSKYDGIGNSDVFQISSSTSGLYWQDLTVSTGMEDATGRDIAIQDKGTRNIYKNVKLHGYQDTWNSNNDNGLYYFEGGIVRGRTDYLCGKGDIFFNGVELQQIADGYAAVPSKPANIGWVFKDCTINGDGSGVNGKYTLGRPWGSGTPVAVFIDTKMNVVPSAIGWSEMSGGWPARFAEYNSMTSNGSQIDLTGRKTTFGDGHENNPVLTAEEAAAYSDMSAMYGEWDPTEATEQVTAPTNVVLTGSTLTWDDNQYALLYAICKNGNVTAFTTDATYNVDDASATWTIRAANAMGGLSEQSEEAIVAPNTVTIQMNGAGIMTYASVYNLDFAGSGLTAYVCEGSEIVSDTELKLTMTAKDSAPAGTGLMLKGEKSASFTVSTTATPAEITVNKIVGVTEPTNITPEENGGQIINFILANGKHGVDWYTLSEAGTIAANRAYLQLDRNEVYDQTGNARTVKMAFDDVIDTGIDNIQIDNSLLDDSKPMYNVAGQRVSRSYKGIVIQNGKKVIK